MVGDQNPAPEAPPRNKNGQERSKQRKCQGKSDCQRSDVEGSCVRVIEEEEVRGNDPVECFLPTGVGSTSLVPEGVMAIEVPKDEEISGGGKNGGRKEVDSAIHMRRANRGSIHIKK